MSFYSSKLNKNILSYLLGGVWSGLLVVVVTPQYVSLLGFEGYGLIGFWMMMQMLLSICDLGLGSALIREISDPSFEDVKRCHLIRTLEYIYWPFSIIIIVGMYLLSSNIATSWLKLSLYSVNQVSSAIKLMSLALGLQFPCALYSSGLSGLQFHGRINVLQSVGNTARYIGGVTILYLNPDPVLFFSSQSIFALIQTLFTRWLLTRAISVQSHISPRFSILLLSRMWKFSTGMALTMIAGVLLSNVDRIFISKLLSAEDLGRYTLAFTATGLLQMGIQPFYRVYFPKLSELFKSKQICALRIEYYKGCKLVSLLIVPVTILSYAFAPEIFTIWTGKLDRDVVKIFRLLLLGITCSGLAWLPAAFQQACGWTKLHAAMIWGALFIGTPIMFLTVKQWGAAGATFVWVLHGMTDITLGLWLMHKRLLKGELILWYRKTLFMPTLCCLPIVVFSWFFLPLEFSDLENFLWITATAIIIIIVSSYFVKKYQWLSI